MNMKKANFNLIKNAETRMAVHTHTHTHTHTCSFIGSVANDLVRTNLKKLGAIIASFYNVKIKSNLWINVRCPRLLFCVFII
jgi:hypothetical protein